MFVLYVAEAAMLSCTSSCAVQTMLPYVMWCAVLLLSHMLSKAAAAHTGSDCMICSLTKDFFIIGHADHKSFWL